MKERHDTGWADRGRTGRNARRAGLIVGSLELSEDGKAMKYFEVADFDLRLNAAALAEAAQTLTNSEPDKGSVTKERS